YSTTPLASSARNIYGIYPEGMNTWETTFTQSLDRDSNGIVLWWHRNESRKSCSVNVLMPNGRGFFPDFIIGIRGRKTENNVLLLDPKFYFADKEQHPKVQSEHKIYGKVMIVFQDPAKRWFTVTWDYKKDAPVAEREFRLSDAAGF
ncbi:MAG: hypothetical protein LBV54_06535, partial [Puniceicoccales bacterium]|nr:hypothetical protein [Puniceicoccales bacterium]